MVETKSTRTTTGIDRARVASNPNFDGTNPIPTGPNAAGDRAGNPFSSDATIWDETGEKQRLLNLGAPRRQRDEEDERQSIEQIRQRKEAEELKQYYAAPLAPLNYRAAGLSLVETSRAFYDQKKLRNSIEINFIGKDIVKIQRSFYEHAKRIESELSSAQNRGEVIAAIIRINLFALKCQEYEAEFQQQLSPVAESNKVGRNLHQDLRNVLIDILATFKETAKIKMDEVSTNPNS